MNANSLTLPIASPGRPGYAEAIASFNVHPSPAPAETIIARSTADVQAAVRYARARGLEVSVISTGHSIATSQPLDGALLVRTAFDAPVVIDAEARTAVIPAGVRWGAVAEAAAPHGLAALHGSSPSVSAVGYLLRGGISFYGRRHGIAANSVVSLTLVQADGEVVTASDEENSDLFWAIRGGGGGFGIVTEITVRLHPVWRAITGLTVWDAEHADPVLRAWASWARTAPVGATTSYRIMQLPPMDGIPEFLTGRPVVLIDGVIAVETAEELAEMTSIADGLAEQLAHLAPPIFDDWALRDVSAVPGAHLEPADPLPYVGDHMLLAGVELDELGQLVELALPPHSALTSVELRQLGGAFAQPTAPGGVFDRTDADFALLLVGAIGGPLTADAHDTTMRGIRQALAHRDTGRTLPTFVESAEQPNRTFDPQTENAVAVVRRRVDPDGMFARSIVPFVER